MPRRLLIRLDAQGDAAWLALGRDGTPLHGERAGLPEPAADIVETIVLVPAEDVLVLPLPDLPGSPRQRQQALPFAIEEQLAAPVEQQHVVLAAQPEAVLVVARARMQAWLSRLRAAGLTVDRMLPDGWLLPFAPATLLLHGERALLRGAGDRLLALPAAQLEEQFGLLAAVDAAPPSLQVLRIGNDSAVPSPVQQERAFPDLLTALASLLPSAGALDLLQGEYAPRHRHAGAQRSWRVAAGLAAAALLVAFAFAIGEYYALDARWQQQQADMEAIYRAVVPGTTPVPDPAARMRSLLGARSAADGGDGALALLGLVAPAIAGSGRYTIDAVEYRGGALELTLRAADVATLDALRARLEDTPRLSAELTAATPGSAGVEGRLRVRMGGPA